MLHACLTYQGVVLTMAMRLDNSAREKLRYVGVQMFDAHGNAMPQPYPDTDEMVELRHGNPHPAVWVVDMRNLSPDLTLQSVDPESFQEALRDRSYKVYDAEMGKIVLAPGYERLKNGRIAPENDAGLAKSHVAFGGLRLWKMADGVRGMAIDTDLPMAGNPRVLTDLKDKLKVRKEKEKAARGNETDAG